MVTGFPVAVVRWVPVLTGPSVEPDSSTKTVAARRMVSVTSMYSEMMTGPS